MNDDDFSQERFDRLSAGQSILEIVRSGVLSARPSEPLFRAAVLALVVDLNFLLLAMAAANRRFDRLPFAPARPRKDGTPADLTEVIRRFRNSLCHAGGPEREWLGDEDDGSSVRVGWIVIAGGVAGVQGWGGRKMPAPPDGDLMVGTGGHFLMVNADLRYAIEDALDFAGVSWRR
ncbi:hypothetical protein GGQ80_002068 [Sphingomonas jinjuensis]|uniref:Uncharacterized protein n=1 Tax=Sphingomonas jinjuensis TaxID=535907 RepID=A0A840FJM3_9SPHN|nr:hypothetical protein [Sphingomonas jinjuensis]MBB4154158.1 hypothetical protein [Sphingomonas jinjuensis]